MCYSPDETASSEGLFFIKREMNEEIKKTEDDKTLIEMAKNLHYSDWALCEDLASKAESLEAKQLINYIGKKLFRREEYMGDNQ